MNNKSKQKLNSVLGKSQSITFRFMATVIFAMLAITIFIGGISIYEVDNYIQNQSENFVSVTSVSSSEKINSSLKNMEKSVNIMESYLMEFFTSEEDVLNRDLQEEVIKNADLMFVDVAKHTSTTDAVSYYFRLDPVISHGKSGLFYSKINGEFVSFEPTDITIYDKSDVEHVGWFWQPYEAQKPVWLKPYHNQNNNILMISYVIPMYYGERFIGVVGMDFDYKALENQVEAIKVYDNGFAHLELNGEIISNHVINFDSKNYLSASQDLANGMTLVLSASYDDIRKIRYDIGFKIFITVVVLFALFTVISTFVVKKITDPLKKLTNAVTKLGDGNYDMEIDKSSASEIKFLSAAFENMAVRLREREQSLRLSANRDSMTGLRNTTSYVAWIAEFDKKISNGGVDFGVAMIDLNDLKITNDEYGHKIGDSLIVTSAKIISDVFKKSPVFRIGGDEFLVVLQNEDLKNCEELFSLLQLKCLSTFVADTHKPISIAVGFSRFNPDKDLRFIDVFKRADYQMYENKKQMKSKS